MSVLVLDTHVLVWWMQANPKLPSKLRALINAAETDLHLPALVVAELIDIALKGRNNLALATVISVLREDGRFFIHDLTADMALGTADYASLPDIHDRCIVPTTANLLAAGTDAKLATHDKMIRESTIVPIIWD